MGEDEGILLAFFSCIPEARWHNLGGALDDDFGRSGAHVVR